VEYTQFVEHLCIASNAPKALNSSDLSNNGWVKTEPNIRYLACSTSYQIVCPVAAAAFSAERLQMICLEYHFAVEQRARSYLRTFYGFNGTGGVWRRQAMEEAGSWNMDSTVEDMDLSLRAYLQGWKFK
jgi:hypothetical protein